MTVGTKLYIFGGHDENKQFEDFYSYDTVKKEWKLLTKLDEEGEPKAHTYYLMASDANHVYVFGGVSKGGTNQTPVRFRTIEAYNIAAGIWVQLPDPGVQFEKFEKRGASGFIVVQGKIRVIYGFANSPDPNGKNDYESDLVNYFNPATEIWTEVETKGQKPLARRVFGHALVGKYILIFGGEIWRDPKAHLSPGTLSSEDFALNTETLVWEKFGGGTEPGQLGWPAYTSATVYGKKGLLMHGGKRPTNNPTD